MFAKKTLYRGFNGYMPQELIPLYEQLSYVLNYILSNKVCRRQLEGYIKISNRGKFGKSAFINHFNPLFKDIRDKFMGDIPNKAWYFSMILKNLFQLVVSLKERYLIYEILEKYNFKITNEVWDEVRFKVKYATRGYIKNISKQGLNGIRPSLPKSIVFKMDYSESNSTHNFIPIKDKPNAWNIQIGKKKYIPYEIVLPLSLRSNLTGHVCKPTFRKTKDGRYVADLSYEIEPYPLAEGATNILGVDLGRLGTDTDRTQKMYSATVLYSETGRYSDEIINSKRIQSLIEKINALRREYYGYESSGTFAKQERTKVYLNRSNEWITLRDKYNKRVGYISFICAKITRLKDQIARLIACEVVDIAHKNKCSVISLEDLRWLGSIVGKWNFSRIQQYIKEVAILYSIRVERVNCVDTSCTHPVTSDKGTTVNRKVMFKDGVLIEVQDRDRIAGANVANRSKKQKHIVPTYIGAYNKTPKRFKTMKSHRQIVKNLRTYLAQRELNKKEADMSMVISTMQQGPSPLHVGLVTNSKLNSLLEKRWKKGLNDQFSSFTTVCYRI